MSVESDLRAEIQGLNRTISDLNARLAAADRASSDFAANLAAKDREISDIRAQLVAANLLLATANTSLLACGNARAAAEARIVVLEAQVAALTPPAIVSTMPTTAPPGWTSLVREDFTTVAGAGLGTFKTADPNDWYLPSTHPYKDVLRVYPDGWDDTDHLAKYYPSKTVDVLADKYGAPGVLRVHGHTETINGTPHALAAAVYAVINPAGANSTAQTAQKYGRYSVRFRTEGGLGYGTAFLLWPGSDIWQEGEVDYPEMGWGDVIKAYVHEVGNPGNNADITTTTVTTDSGWHVATTEWYPNAIIFYLDGVRIKKVNISVPQTVFRWGFQSGGHGVIPDPSSVGDLFVDWFTIEKYNGAATPA